VLQRTKEKGTDFMRTGRSMLWEKINHAGALRHTSWKS
jgi:hypothetical protein